MSLLPVGIECVEGSLRATRPWRFGVVASRFNELVVDRLIVGAVDCLTRHGIDSDAITLVRVPGAWELPLACQKLASSDQIDALIALGAVVRGVTAHFEHVAQAATKGCLDVMLRAGKPVGLGILTTDTVDQALERAGSKAGNKGWDAALSVLEMTSVLEQLSSREG